MPDPDDKLALRLVLNDNGRTHGAQVARRLEALGITDVVVSPRAVNARLTRDEVQRIFHLEWSGETPKSPPASDTLKALELDQFVEYGYFPSRPTYFGR